MTGYVCIAQQLSGIVTDGLNEPIPGAKNRIKGFAGRHVHRCRRAIPFDR